MKKTFAFTYTVGEEYTNGEDVVKIVGFNESAIIVNDGREFDINIEVNEFISEWWKPEEEN